jgi:hypothetical protein
VSTNAPAFSKVLFPFVLSVVGGFGFFLCFKKASHHACHV